MGLPFSTAGSEFARTWKSAPTTVSHKNTKLEKYAQANNDGPGIWKWQHYYEIYTHHLERFIGRDVHVLEIGIFSGGSLGMWRNFFGDQATIYGVDIEPACVAYESKGINIFIGDQADPGFWHNFKAHVPRIDVLLDDGGHSPRQQLVTLEEMLPYISPGGVYICEDIHGSDNYFASYCQSLAAEINTANWTTRDMSGRRLVCESTPFQASIASINFYPFTVVIEKRETPIKLSAEGKGTEWQPFYERK